MRKDLGALRPGDEVAVDLKILVRRRTDLVNDRTRQINRLRQQLLEISPALERALNLTNKGPVLLLTGYQTPAAIRRTGSQAHRDLAEEPQGQGRRCARPGRRRRGPLSAHTAARREAGRLDGGPPREGGDGPRRGDRRARRTHRGPVSRAPARGSDPQPARHGCHARGRRSSPPPAETWNPSAPPTAWPRSPGCPRSRATPAASAATCAGPTLPHRNGRAEGVNARTKRIMRQMHGRAGFVPLRRRILLQ